MIRNAPISAHRRIADFCVEMRADKDFRSLHARLPRTHPLITGHKATQIRTSAHDADAFALDVLGNVTVMWSDGRIQQLISNEEIKAAKLFR